MKYTVTLSHPITMDGKPIEADTVLHGMSVSFVTGLQSCKHRRDTIVPETDFDTPKNIFSKKGASSTGAAEHAGTDVVSHNVSSASSDAGEVK